ncbi:MAG: PAS domain S-box protein [Candidatus Zixiibacteriota bacterium]|nr:MAG: PAS domain S-box protein [candidate division Zixibacteria bacterium]
MNRGDIKILVGDTDQKSLQRLRKILAEESYGVWTSDDAGELLRIYEAGTFDLLILDVRLYAQLRRQRFPVEPQAEHFPLIIVMTGEEDFPATVEAIKEGAIDFLERPIRVKRLLITIRNALQHRHKLQEMRRDQQELAFLKELYERIINGIDYGIVVLDSNLRIESINEYLKRKQRKDTSRSLGRPCYRFFYDRRTICNDCRIKEVFETGAPVRYKLVQKTAWGTQHYMEVEAFPLFDPEGRVNRVVQLIKDVTERVKLEQELREKKDYLENLLSHAPVGIFSTDSRGFIQAANPAFAQIIGARESSDALGLNVLEFEDFRKNGLDQKFRLVLEKGEPQEVERLACESSWGHSSICSLRCVPLRGEGGAIAGLIATVEDVTTKHQLEESYQKRIAELTNFKEVGELLQSTVDLADIYAITLIGVTAGMGLGFNRAFLLRYDRGSNTLIGETAIGPSDAAEAGRIWSELYEKKLSLKEIFDNYKETLDDKDVKVREVVKRLRIPLTWEEGLFQEVLFHNLPQNVTGASQGRYADQKLISKTIGSDAFAVVPLISRGKAEGVIIADNLITGKEITDEDVKRLSIITNQAGTVIENTRLLRNLEEKVEALRLAYLDLKENRDRLLRAERLSAVGEVAAMVAHEIRNPLTSIGGFARAVMRDMGKAEKAETNRRFLNIILEEVKRLERIVTEILGFIRPLTMNFTPTNLHEVIDQTFSMMAGEIDETKIIVTRDYQPNLPAVMADADQIRQVLLNLLRNALHAMHNEGMLSVITETVEDNIRIYIADTGEGIRAEHLDKLFNAFFTTKASGSGLGLTICMQIIRGHGGTIEVDSREGEGSTFIVTLPVRREEVDHEEANSRGGRREEPANSV